MGEKSQNIHHHNSFNDLDLLAYPSSMGQEISSADCYFMSPSYRAIIILGWGHHPDCLQVGIYLLFYTLLASLPLLVGFFTFIILII